MRFILLIIFVLISSIPSASAEAPSGVVRQAIILGDDAPKLFFAKALLEAMHKVPDGCDAWDANIITGRQSQTGVNILRIDEAINDGRSAEVNVTLRTIIEDEIQPPEKQTFVLLKENNEWKISDILFYNRYVAAKTKGTRSLRSSLEDACGKPSPEDEYLAARDKAISKITAMRQATASEDKSGAQEDKLQADLENRLRVILGTSPSRDFLDPARSISPASTLRV